MNNETENVKTKTKHKSPSKQRRDAARMERLRDWHPPPRVDSATQTDDTGSEGIPTCKGIDPREIYANCHHSMQLARLEEPSVLTTALRHLVRIGHPNGGRITFPVMEAVDRIYLKTMSLPTSHGELQGLVFEVFHRRGEIFNIDDIYKQAVRAHGRTEFDPRKPSPECYIHTYTP